MNDKPLPEWLHRPFLLNEEELADPKMVITNFIVARQLPAHREMIWSLLHAALVSSKENFTSADEVANWVLYCREVEKLIEAIYLSYG